MRNNWKVIFALISLTEKNKNLMPNTALIIGREKHSFIP